jgi:hypothetical protein
LTTAEISDIAKAYYITENEESEFMETLEREGTEFMGDLVVQRLKEAKEVSIDEIHAIAKSYLITRVGSRELYKLLEIVTNHINS